MPVTTQDLSYTLVKGFRQKDIISGSTTNMTANESPMIDGNNGGPRTMPQVAWIKVSVNPNVDAEDAFGDGGPSYAHGCSTGQWRISTHQLNISGWFPFFGGANNSLESDALSQCQSNQRCGFKYEWMESNPMMSIGHSSPQSPFFQTELDPEYNFNIRYGTLPDGTTMVVPRFADGDEFSGLPYFASGVNYSTGLEDDYSWASVKNTRTGYVHYRNYITDNNQDYSDVSSYGLQNESSPFSYFSPWSNWGDEYSNWTLEYYKSNFSAGGCWNSPSNVGPVNDWLDCVFAGLETDTYGYDEGNWSANNVYGTNGPFNLSGYTVPEGEDAHSRWHPAVREVAMFNTVGTTVLDFENNDGSQQNGYIVGKPGNEVMIFVVFHAPAYDLSQSTSSGYKQNRATWMMNSGQVDNIINGNEFIGLTDDDMLYVGPETDEEFYDMFNGVNSWNMNSLQQGDGTYGDNKSALITLDINGNAYFICGEDLIANPDDESVDGDIVIYWAEETFAADMPGSSKPSGSASKLDGGIRVKSLGQWDSIDMREDPIKNRTGVRLWGKLRTNRTARIANVRMTAPDGYYFPKKPYLKTQIGDDIKLEVKKITRDDNNRIVSYEFFVSHTLKKRRKRRERVVAVLDNYNVIEDTKNYVDKYIDRITYGGGGINPKGEDKEIRIFGTPGAEFYLAVNETLEYDIEGRKHSDKGDDVSILTNSNAVDLNHYGQDMPILHGYIPSTGVYSFIQKFPGLMIQRTTCTSGGTKTTFDFNDVSNVKEGDRLFTRGLSEDTVVLVDTGGKVSDTRLTFDSTVTIPTNQDINMRRYRSYSIGLLPESSPISTNNKAPYSLTENNPQIRLNQRLNPIITISNKTHSDFAITHNNGVSTGPLGAGVALTTKLVGKPNFRPNKSTNITYSATYDLTLDLAGGGVFSTFTKPNFDIKNQDNSNWTNSVPSANGGTKVKIYNISHTATGSGTINLKYKVDVIHWGKEDVTIEIDIDSLLTHT
jgi:hypothetical protein